MPKHSRQPPRRGLGLLALLALLAAAGCGPLREDVEARAAQKAAADEARRAAAIEAREAKLQEERRAREAAAAAEEEQARLAATARARSACITRARMHTLWHAVRLYYASFSAFPDDQAQLREPPDGGPAIIEAPVRDDWGHPLRIRHDDGKLEIRSAGADGVPGGDGDPTLVANVSWGECGAVNLAVEVTGDDMREDAAGACDDPEVAAAEQRSAALSARVDEAVALAGRDSFYAFVEDQIELRCGRQAPVGGQVELGVRTEGHARFVARRAKWQKALQIGEWATACTDFGGMHASHCHAQDSAYATGVCLERQKTAMEKRTLFVTDALSTVSYDAARKRFAVGVIGVLATTRGSVGLTNCWRDTCRGKIVATRPLRVREGEGNFPVWQRRFEKAIGRVLGTIETFRVRESAIEAPRRFESELQVEVLVEVVDQQYVRVGEWFDFENLQVRVVGMRAYTRDLGWWKMLQRPDLKGRPLACPVPELR